MGGRPTRESGTTTARRLVGAVLLVAVLPISGCAESPEDPGAPRDESPGTPASSQATTALPGGPLGDQARWVLAQLRPGADALGEAEARRRFTSQLLAQVPVESLAATFAQVRRSGPYSVVEVAPEQQDAQDGRSTAVRLAGREALVMQIALGPGDRIAGLTLGPDPEAGSAPAYADLDELTADLSELGAAEVYAGDVSDDGCSTRYRSSAGYAPAPSGSVFKLLVLTAVADAVRAGDLSWDDDLTLTASGRSLPSGELQDRAVGSTVAVRQAADLMMSLSDNTAADLLMEAVGRDRLRSAAEGVGLRHPSMRPPLRTGEYFRLGWAASQAARDGWADADRVERRDILQALPRSLPNAGQVREPVWRSGVGYFLDGAEVCAVYARLRDQAAQDDGAPLRRILSGTTGPVGATDAEILAAKGGSAPGVYAASYLVADDEGPPRVLVVQVRGDTDVSPAALDAVVRGGLALVAGDAP